MSQFVSHFYGDAMTSPQTIYDRIKHASKMLHKYFFNQDYHEKNYDNGNRPVAINRNADKSLSVIMTVMVAPDFPYVIEHPCKEVDQLADAFEKAGFNKIRIEKKEKSHANKGSRKGGTDYLYKLTVTVPEDKASAKKFYTLAYAKARDAFLKSLEEGLDKIATTHPRDEFGAAAIKTALRALKRTNPQRPENTVTRQTRRAARKTPKQP
jgi:hypothetical protein